MPVILGAGVILYSIFTDYELGAVRRISMRTHLWLDILGGAFLAVSPWLFDFNEWVYMPHLLLGLAEVGAGIFTRTTPDRAPVHTPVHEGDRARAGYTDRADLNNSTAASRPPMGSNAETRTRTESDRIRKDL
ncbi:SPW repeat domain-containing protein [Cesiribacter andamanensis]|uniref:SPW repeat-containing integral membrane domain-containing protein n=1 Tax=Cesiribacter andamanensis AMV16 TaxID=1279009 RepID=M7MY19_9BACT|nr:hypothetical protein [Cesiribacter andamanensis]EMR01328.1 hypothetical protein ADICEAN_03556 [Cesiribacter andamanensis AMV16]